MTILKLSQSQFDVSELEALNQREWKYRSEPYAHYASTKREPVKVEFRKMMYCMPLLWISGIFTGVGIMIALR